MFDSLRKKLSNWLGKPEKEAKKPVKTKKETPLSKTEKRKRTKEELKEERKTTKKVIKDIKTEFGEEIKSIPQIESVKDSSETQEAPKQGFFSKLFKKVSDKVASHTLSEEDFNEIFSDLEIILLENNVALEVVDKIRENLSKSLIGIEIKKSEIQNKVIESLKDSILSVLIEPPNLIDAIRASKEPYVILFFGINGTGKTTSIAKLAHLLKENGISSCMAAADTFRAASIEQLQAHGNKLSIPVISQQYNSDPSAVAFDALSYAKKHSIKAVLIDTAGRMYTKANLLKEMEKIIRVSKPNLKIFVGESITGNDAVEQAKTFNETAGIDGIILSKADIDEKAGTILSVSYVTNKPIYYLGVGQEYKDLEPFKKSEIIKNLGLNSTQNL